MLQNNYITDPVLYLLMLLGFGGVHVLISSFNDDDGERYIYNFMCTNLAN